jgi:hypothetical protein
VGPAFGRRALVVRCGCFSSKDGHRAPIEQVGIKLRAVSRFADGRVGIKLRAVSRFADGRVGIKLRAVSRFADGRVGQSPIEARPRHKKKEGTGFPIPPPVQIDVSADLPLILRRKSFP